MTQNFSGIRRLRAKRVKNWKHFVCFMVGNGFFCFWFQCSPGGCLMELAQQLAIIMIGKQVIGNVQEVLIP